MRSAGSYSETFIPVFRKNSWRPRIRRKRRHQVPHRMLPDKKRAGAGWQPPLPLIIAAWWHTTGMEKMLRLEEHIEYAAENGALDAVDIFLRELSPEEWHTARKT